MPINGENINIEILIYEMYELIYKLVSIVNILVSQRGKILHKKNFMQ